MTTTQFPEKLKDREIFIFDQILAGNFEATWTEIVRYISGKEVKLHVMEDALIVAGVRVNVSATLEQKIADLFDASLPTAMVADMMYSAAVRRATPCPMPISSTVSSMVAHSNSVGKQLTAPSGLVSTTGKHWILDKKIELNPKRACNYGWHFTGPSYKGIAGFAAASAAGGPGVKVIQPNATAHDALHSDYSQVCQLVSQRCWINGSEYRFSDVVKDVQLAGLISHNGALKFDRQPGTIPYTGCKLTLPFRIPSSCPTA